MKLWKVAIVVEVAIVARTKGAAIEEALKIPWSDLGEQPVTAKVVKQITHVKHLPCGVCEDDLAWVADDSLDIICPRDADCASAILLEQQIKKGLKTYGAQPREALE